MNPNSENPLKSENSSEKIGDGGGDRGGRQSAAGVDYGLDEGVLGAHAAAAGFAVAREDVDAEIYSEAEKDREQADGDLVEVADDDLGQPEGPGQRHQQRNDYEDRRENLAEVEGYEHQDPDECQHRRGPEIVDDDLVLLGSVLETALVVALDVGVETGRIDRRDGLVEAAAQPAGELDVGDHPCGIQAQDHPVLLLGQVVVTLEAAGLVRFVLPLDVAEVEAVPTLLVVEPEVEGGALQLFELDVVLDAAADLLEVPCLHVEQAVAAEEPGALAADYRADQWIAFQRVGEDEHEVDAALQVAAGDDDHRRPDAADPLLDAVELANAVVVVGQKVGRIRLDAQLQGEAAGYERQSQRHKDDADVVVVDVVDYAFVADAHRFPVSRPTGFRAGS